MDPGSSVIFLIPKEVMILFLVTAVFFFFATLSTFDLG